LVKVSFGTEVTVRTSPSDLPQRNSETGPTRTLGFIPNGGVLRTIAERTIPHLCRSIRPFERLPRRPRPCVRRNGANDGINSGHSAFRPGRLTATGEHLSAYLVGPRRCRSAPQPEFQHREAPNAGRIRVPQLRFCVGRLYRRGGGRWPHGMSPLRHIPDDPRPIPAARRGELRTFGCSYQQVLGHPHGLGVGCRIYPT